MHTGAENGGLWNYASVERAYSQYDTLIKDTVTINSDWINDEQAAWLEELFTSPAVYLERADNSLIAVNIQTNNYEIRKKANDKLINIQLSFTYAFDRYRQRM